MGASKGEKKFGHLNFFKKPSILASPGERKKSGGKSEGVASGSELYLEAFRGKKKSLWSLSKFLGAVDFNYLWERRQKKRRDLYDY